MASIYDGMTGPLPLNQGLYGGVNDLNAFANRGFDPFTEIQRALAGTDTGYQNQLSPQNISPEGISGARGSGQPVDPRIPISSAQQGTGMERAGTPGGILESPRTRSMVPQTQQSIPQPQQQTPQAPIPGNTQNPPVGATPQSANSMQQAWMNQNQGWGADLMKFMASGQGNAAIDPMNIQWVNPDTGAQENITRALGVIQQGGADALAKILGGQAVDSPFATFGTQQRDKYIRMPNGQMIDASALSNSLQGASKSSNPFSSISDVINMYKAEQQGYNPKGNSDLFTLMNQGVVKPGTPEGWANRNYVGGDSTYTPTGPVPGNPNNPGMGTSNPIQFQGGRINAVNGQNGFPIFNFAQPQAGLPNNGGLYNSPGTPQGQQPSGGGTSLPPAPQAPQVPQTPGPQGVNTNSNYYLPSAMSGQGGLYAQTGNSQSSSGPAGGGGAVVNSASGSGRIGAVGDMQQTQQAPKSSWAGNLPNGARSLGK